MASTPPLSKKAHVLRSGAILLGKSVVCDGFDWHRPVGVVTHVHGDHIQEFETILGFCDPILMSPPTKDLMVALKGDHLLLRRNLRSVNFGDPLTHCDERITLYQTDHILGASQVLVENEEGTRIVYTGDFNFPTKVIEADVLVVDATYGDPINIRNYNKRVPVSRLLSLVKREIEKQKPVYIFSYHGKIQQIMHFLDDAHINMPFLVPLKDFKIAKVYEKYGFKTGDCIKLEDQEACEIIKRCDPYIAFYTVGSRVAEAERFLSIRVSAYEAIEPVFKVAKNRYVVAISDHADFYGILEYVKRSHPKLVITDASRRGNAMILASEIKKRLNVTAQPCPI